MSIRCTVCGSAEHTLHNVLWDGLVNEWQLSHVERHYINQQQGLTCTCCGAKLRCMTLAQAVMAAADSRDIIFQQFVASEGAGRLKVLEVNEAGTLHRWLSQMPGHVSVHYPEVDIHDLPAPDQEFDLVIHADTLEHVENPVHALAECRRVLKDGGVLVFTIPMIVGRLSRSRGGLKHSYHGDPAASAEDYLVHTEFGADAWTFPMEAGFKSVSISTLMYPQSVAISATK